MPDKHFDKLFWFCVALCGAAFAFDIAIVFIPVPKSGEKYADILIGSINAGALSSAITYLLGGSAKKEDKPVASTESGNIQVGK